MLGLQLLTRLNEEAVRQRHQDRQHLFEVPAQQLLFERAQDQEADLEDGLPAVNNEMVPKATELPRVVGALLLVQGTREYGDEE